MSFGDIKIVAAPRMPENGIALLSGQPWRERVSTALIAPDGSLGPVLNLNETESSVFVRYYLGPSAPRRLR